MTTTLRVPLCIPANHPALAGHFPGRPLVPGVVLLERVAAACRALRGGRVSRLDAKFLRPLRPDESADIALEMLERGRVRFAVTGAGGAAIARGTLGLDAAA